jgi:hypothetical protein
MISNKIGVYIGVIGFSTLARLAMNVTVCFCEYNNTD